jgi:phenylpropionate dioxygenase-like ring-hydroxylating dioxygenase large terminal subunit
MTLELAGQPVMVIRDQDGTLRAQSNVCLHRMSTLLTGSGNTKAIVCPYHAWSYNLDGSLRGAPAMTLNEGFCKNSYKLPQVRCEEWLGWIMVSLNPDAPPVSESLAEVQELIGQYGMEDYTETFQETHVWDTNWKVLAENFMESYHLPVCHAGTIGGLSKLDEMDCPPGRQAFNYHFILKDDSAEDCAGASVEHAAARKLAPHHDLDGDLSEPADHADTGLFLVPVVASERGGAGAASFSVAACRRIS